MDFSDILKEEEGNRITQKKRNLSSFIDLIIVNIRKVINDVTHNNVFRVNIESNKQSENILSEIADLLRSIGHSLKISQEARPGGQKISIKTPDLITLNKNIEDILKRIEQKEIKINIPNTQRVMGDVRVNNLPQQYDFNRILSALKEISSVISKIKLEPQKLPEIKIPEIKTPEFPKSLNVPGILQIIDALKELKEEIKLIPKNIPKSEFPTGMKVHVENFPPQKYPMPVTNININPLRGNVRSRNINVITNPIAIPSDSLSYRRALVIFNNSSSTVYLGGNDVTITNGLPVLAQTYSPALDAGPKMTIYGVVALGTAEVRVFEAANEDVGG